MKRKYAETAEAKLAKVEKLLADVKARREALGTSKEWWFTHTTIDMGLLKEFIANLEAALAEPKAKTEREVRK